MLSAFFRRPSSRNGRRTSLSSSTCEMNVHNNNNSHSNVNNNDRDNCCSEPGAVEGAEKVARKSRRYMFSRIQGHISGSTCLKRPARGDDLCDNDNGCNSNSNKRERASTSVSTMMAVVMAPEPQPVVVERRLEIVSESPTRSVPEALVLSEDDVQEVREKLKSPRATEVVVAVAEKYSKLVDLSVVDHKGLCEANLMTCGKAIPNVSLLKYLGRLVVYLNRLFEEEDGDVIQSVGLRCLLLGTVYIDRLLASRKDFKLNIFNVHRLAFGATWMALKFTEDDLPPCDILARISGLDADQLRTIEAGFCRLMEFRFGLDRERDIRALFENYGIPLNPSF